MTIPSYILTVIITIMVLHFFVAESPQLEWIRAEILDWGTTIAAFGLLVGAFTLMVSHLKRILGGVQREGGRQFFYSVSFFVMFAIYFVIGIAFSGLTSSKEFTSLWSTFMIPSKTTIGALVFVMETAIIYYAFRIRSIESFVFLLSGVIMILRSMPIGPVLWPPIAPLGDWFLNYPNAAGSRANVIAAAVGSLILIIRAWLGRERSLIGLEVK